MIQQVHLLLEVFANTVYQINLKKRFSANKVEHHVFGGKIVIKIICKNKINSLFGGFP